MTVADGGEVDGPVPGDWQRVKMVECELERKRGLTIAYTVTASREQGERRSYDECE